MRIINNVWIAIFITFFTNAMESESFKEWSTHTLSVTKNTETGEKTYQGVYPVEFPRGLVRVKTVFFNKNIVQKNVHLTVDRHTKDQIIITAMLAKKIVLANDESEQDNNYFKQRDKIWVPWWTDIVQPLLESFQPVSRAKLRGGNRLSVQLREEGRYHIMLPYDADAEIKMKVGDIDYQSKIPTTLRIKSRTVNETGHSHAYTPGKGVSSEYGRADEHSPYSSQTYLEAKTGHINVPESKTLNQNF